MTTTTKTEAQIAEQLEKDVKSFKLHDADVVSIQKEGNVWEISFSADKNGCDYYEARSVEECNDGLDEDDEDYDYDCGDDDFPNFVGEGIVANAIKAHFKNVAFEIQDHEKGYFSVYVRPLKLKKP